MQLVRLRSAVSAATSAVRRLVSAVDELRTLLHTLIWWKATLLGLCTWAVATVAFTVLVSSGLTIKSVACDYPAEMFSQLGDTAVGWDLWFNTPWSFTVAVVAILLSMRSAQYIGLRAVKVVAYGSLPWQAWWWHGLLMLPECS